MDGRRPRRSPVPRNGQIVRILRLARALAASRRGISLKEFAAREEWNWRAVYRDRDALVEAGFAIEEVSHGRYRMSEDWAPPNLPDIRPEEIAAFFSLRALAQTWRGTALGRPLDDLWAKLTAGSARQGALLPRSNEPWLSVRSPIAIDYRRHQKTIAVFDHAIRERLVVSCRYRALSTRQSTSRPIEPGELHWDPGLETLYVIGWCRLRQAVRIFAVHRFQAIALTDERFTPRSDTKSAVALKYAFRVWRGANVQTVKLRFGPAVADEIRERQWGPGQKIDDDGEGGLFLTLELANSLEVERWILGFGPDVEVVAPAALRDRVAVGLEAGARSYATLEKRERKRPHRVPNRRPKTSEAPEDAGGSPSSSAGERA